MINGWVGKDSLISLRIGKSRYSLKPLDVPGNQTESYTVKNAVPVIFENNIPIDTLVYDVSAYNYRTLRGAAFRAGRTYSVRVKAPGFTEAWAESIVPSQSEVASVQRTRNARTNSFGQSEDEIIIRLNDPAGENNFYMVQVYSPVYSGGYSYPLSCVRTTDKDVEVLGYADPMDTENCHNGGEILMKDTYFNGSQKVLKLYAESSMLQEMTDMNTGQINRPYIHVLRITEEHYKFIKSYSLYSNTNENPFAEPVNVFSNVNNGYGVFSIFTKFTDTLR